MDYKPKVDEVVWLAEKCWGEIIKQNQRERIIIAGMNPNKDVMKLVELTGVEVTGFVDDILPYYHQADIFVAPFRLARGVQNKVLQAFSCALPVISTPMGAEGIRCQADRDILLASNPEQFIQQANKLIAQPEIAQSIGESAGKLITKYYSWQSQLQPLVNLLYSEGKQ